MHHQQNIGTAQSQSQNQTFYRFKTKTRLSMQDEILRFTYYAKPDLPHSKNDREASNKKLYEESDAT
jgi:hypothetical protein